MPFVSFVVYIVANRFDRILRKITDLALRSIMRVKSGREYSLCSSVAESKHSGSPQRNRDTENFRFKFTHTK